MFTATHSGLAPGFRIQADHRSEGPRLLELYLGEDQDAFDKNKWKCGTQSRRRLFPSLLSGKGSAV